MFEKISKNIIESNRKRHDEDFRKLNWNGKNNVKCTVNKTDLGLVSICVGPPYIYARAG